MDAVHGEFLVAILGIACDADRADDFAVFVANLHAAALGENLLAARAVEIFHEDRLFLRAYLYELRRAAKRESGVALAERHLEPDHRGTIFLLERLHLAAGLDHD